MKNITILLLLINQFISFSQNSRTDSYFYHIGKQNNHVITAGIIDTIGNGGHDILISKVDTSGDLKWSKILGGAGKEIPKKIFFLNKKVIILSNTSSKGGGLEDVMLIEIDSNGIDSAYILGTGDNESARDFTIENENIFILGSVEMNFNDNETMLIKIDSNFNIIKSTYFQGTGNDFPESYSNGIIVGKTKFYNGFNDDSYILKLDTHDNVLWSKTLSDSTNQSFLDSDIDLFKNIYACGYTENSDGYMSAYLTSLDSNGILNWQKEYSSVLVSKFNKIKFYNGNLYVAGNMQSITGSYDDAFIAKIDTSGTIIWCKRINLPDDEYVTYLDFNKSIIHLGGTKKLKSNLGWSYFMLNLDTLGTSCNSVDLLLNSNLKDLKDSNYVLVKNSYNIQFEYGLATSFNSVLANEMYFCNLFEDSITVIDTTFGNISKIINTDIQFTIYNSQLEFCSDYEKINKIEAYNCLGEKIIETTKINKIISLNNLKGIYVLAFYFKEEIIFKKIYLD